MGYRQQGWRGRTPLASCSSHQDSISPGTGHGATEFYDLLGSNSAWVVSQKVGAEADPTNFLLMHAMGPNVAGVIGTAVAAGTFMAVFGVF